MSFTDKLGLGRPTDISARMEIVDSEGNVVFELDKDGKEIAPAWLEFWGPDSEPVRKFSRHIVAETMIEEKREERSRRKKAPSESEMLRKIDNLDQSAIEGMAVRLKDWRLVNVDGAVVEVPPTKENAMALFGDPEYGYLRLAVLEFLGDETNFFTKRPAPSASSQSDLSKAESAE